MIAKHELEALKDPKDFLLKWLSAEPTKLRSGSTYKDPEKRVDELISVLKKEVRAYLSSKNSFK